MNSFAENSSAILSTCTTLQSRKLENPQNEVDIREYSELAMEKNTVDYFVF